MENKQYRLKNRICKIEAEPYEYTMQGIIGSGILLIGENNIYKKPLFVMYVDKLNKTIYIPLKEKGKHPMDRLIRYAKLYMGRTCLKAKEVYVEV